MHNIWTLFHKSTNIKSNDTPHSKRSLTNLSIPSVDVRNTKCAATRGHVGQRPQFLNTKKALSISFKTKHMSRFSRVLKFVVLFEDGIDYFTLRVDTFQPLSLYTPLPGLVVTFVCGVV